MKATFTTTLGAVVALLALGSCQLSAGPLAAPPAAADSQVSALTAPGLSGKLGYYFAAAPVDGDGVPPASAEPWPEPRIQVGMVYDTDAVMALMQASPPSPAASSLFGKSGLYFHLFDASGKELPSRRLALCESLDIRADRLHPLEQQASCDGHVYAVAASETGILVTVDGRTESHYPLNPGIYALNGVPFRVR